MSENTRVREIRKTISLTLEQFGNRIGVGNTAISKIERGENALTPMARKLICREFGVNENWLKTGEGEMFSRTEKDELDDVLTKFDLPLELRGLFLNYLELSESAKDEVRKLIQKWASSVALTNNEHAKM